MTVVIRELLELVGLSGLILMISLVSFTKMALGAILTLVGAFFPSKQDDKSSGQAKVSISSINAAFRGSLRYGVITAGVVLIIGAIIEGAGDIRSGTKGAAKADYISSMTDEERDNLIKAIRKSDYCKKNPHDESCSIFFLK